MKRNNAAKTTFYATLAGLLFFLAIFLFNQLGKFALLLIVLGAFFDWLPYIAKWMGNVGNKNRLAPKRIGKMPFFIMIHTIVALLSYMVWILWIFFFFNATFGWVFFSLWTIVYVAGIIHQIIKSMPKTAH